MILVFISVIEAHLLSTQTKHKKWFLVFQWTLTLYQLLSIIYKYLGVYVDAVDAKIVSKSFSLSFQTGYIRKVLSLDGNITSEPSHLHFSFFWGVSAVAIVYQTAK